MILEESMCVCLCVCVCVCEGERQTDRQTGRKIGRQAGDRHTQRDRDPCVVSNLGYARSMESQPPAQRHRNRICILRRSKWFVCTFEQVCFSHELQTQSKIATTSLLHTLGSITHLLSYSNPPASYLNSFKYLMGIVIRDKTSSRRNLL
jgi:hypothetical protein